MSKESIVCGDYNILRCKGKVNGKICGKLLGKGIVERGVVEIRCPRCGAYNIFQIGGFKPIETPREIG